MKEAVVVFVKSRSIAAHVSLSVVGSKLVSSNSFLPTPMVAPRKFLVESTNKGNYISQTSYYMYTYSE